MHETHSCAMCLPRSKVLFRDNVTDNSDSALLFVQWYPFLKPGSPQIQVQNTQCPCGSIKMFQLVSDTRLCGNCYWSGWCGCRGRKAKKLGVAVGFLGQCSSSKERIFHESRPLSLPRTASWATLCHEVQLKGPPLSPSASTSFLIYIQS